jgi:hypothetical protein
MVRGQGRQSRRARDKSVEGDIDRLFQLALGEFTRARDALAAKLKKDGAEEKAEVVKALAKPSISTWVANQLYWHNRKAFDRLLAAGEAFRAVQAAQLAGNSADIRAPIAARREALTELAKHASAVLRDTGHASSRETTRRIAMNLEALATYGESPGAPKLGRLTTDLDPPGFEALAALLPRSGDRPPRGSAPTRVTPFSHPKPKKHGRNHDARRQVAQRRAREKEMRRTLRDAERGLEKANRNAKKAHDTMKTVDARAKEMEKRRAALERQLENAKTDADNVHQETLRIATRAEEAARAVEEAERAVQRARRALKDF